MVIYSSILAWGIPWTESESGGLQSVGSQRVRHDLATQHTNTHGFLTFYFAPSHLPFPLCLLALLQYLSSLLPLPLNLPISAVSTLTLARILTPLVNSILESRDQGALKELPRDWQGLILLMTYRL